MIDPATGDVIHEQDNLVVETAAEVAVAALMGNAVVAGVSLGYTGGKPVSAGLQAAPSPVAYAQTGTTAATKPFASRDDQGLRTVGTWQAIFSPQEEITYDTLTLVSSSGRAVAATAFPEITLQPGSDIQFQWTLKLGNDV
jgi:hypothetical protein